MTRRYPFLISVPHGGTDVPLSVRGDLALTDEDLHYYSDPQTRVLFGFGARVSSYIDTSVSRMVVDLNRPPLPLPLEDPDGIIKTKTFKGDDVWLSGRVPDMQKVHRLLMACYFPYHQRIDEMIDSSTVRIAFDCHTMVPVGLPAQEDAGKERPLVCISNNGDYKGRARKNRIATCPAGWITDLAGHFRDEFSCGRDVKINKPFPGGFISNAHYWRKGVPWVQIEINRSLYEEAGIQTAPGTEKEIQARQLRERIWNVLSRFWDGIS